MPEQPKYDASKYAAFRPQYPQALYDVIYSHVDEFDTVWDCGCGNGQASIILAEKFKHVIATDLSATQIEQASPADNISYLIESASNTSIENNSIDHHRPSSTLV
jgi:tRNA/tmRNA/rRNA uracil-C5-methylase (TrmA/RlmC/RlmD family)